MQLEVGNLEVRASFELSYQGCREDDRRTFRLLGLIDAADFAAWVPAALLGVASGETESRVERLADAQLIDPMGEDETGQIRYRFHDLLRVFARERLREEEPLPAQRVALERALRAYIAHAEHAESLLSPVEDVTIDRQMLNRWPASSPAGIASRVRHPMSWFATERWNLVALVNQAYEAELWEITWLLANATMRFFDMSSNRTGWQRTHKLAASAAWRAGNQLAEAAILRKLAKLAHRRGDFNEAIATFDQALMIFRPWVITSGKRAPSAILAGSMWIRAALTARLPACR